MEAVLAYLVLPVLVGIVYFTIFRLIKKSDDISYLHGLILPAFFLVMLLFPGSSQGSSGWYSMTRGFMILFTGIMVITYLISWLIVSLVSKNKKM
jgi:hypothetical protein